MSVVVKNVGAIEFTATGSQNTSKTRTDGNVGAVTITLRGIHYHWGVNESKTLPNDIGAEAVAADGRLRIADSRDGVAQGGGTART